MPPLKLLGAVRDVHPVDSRRVPAASVPPQGPAHILVVDDEEDVHEDYRKCLGSVRDLRADRLDAFRTALFGETSAAVAPEQDYRLIHAHQGDAAVREAARRCARGERIAVAFVDMRMPPGQDGITTARELRRIDPEILIVICTAHADFTWHEVLAGIGDSRGIHLLRKPFDPDQVRKYASVLARKWQLARNGEAPVKRAAAR